MTTGSGCTLKCHDYIGETFFEFEERQTRPDFALPINSLSPKTRPDQII